jgi:ribosomal protein S18 acetylase RimI-like enzyme
MPLTIIRRATEHDYETLIELDQRAWSHESSPTYPFKTSTIADYQHRYPLDTLLVACFQEQVVGYICFQHRTPLASNHHVWQIRSLAVEPHARGQGIASLLLEHCEQAVRAQQGTIIRLSVLGANQKAQRTYERAGFVVTARLYKEFLIDGQWVDDLIMSKSWQV